MESKKLFLISVILAVLIQLIPVMLSEKFIIFTVLSAVPIYICGRKSLIGGILSYIVSSTIVYALSPHEGMFFILTNGLIGISLGLITNKGYSKKVIIHTSSLLLFFSLILIIYAFSIPLFSKLNIENLFLNLAFLLLFCYIYTLTMNSTLNYIYTKYVR